MQELLARQPLLAKVDFVIIGWSVLRTAFLAKDDIIETGARPWRIDMQLSDPISLVSVVSKDLGHRGDFG